MSAAALQVFFPFMVLGSLAVLGGVLTIFMPETLGAAMPENAEVRLCAVLCCAVLAVPKNKEVGLCTVLCCAGRCYAGECRGEPVRCAVAKEIVYCKLRCLVNTQHNNMTLLDVFTHDLCFAGPGRSAVSIHSQAMAQGIPYCCMT